MILIGFYLLFLTLALLLGIVVFRRLRRHGLLVATGGGLLALCGLALFFPVPIHGGLTFPLEIAWQELQRVKWHHEEARREEASQAFQRSLQQRFAGVLSGYRIEEEQEGWSKVRLDEGGSVWLHAQSGLLWRAPQSVAGSGAVMSLQQATAFCQQQAPHGYWSLPTEAELAILWQHEGQRLMPGTGQSSTALLADGALALQVATQYRGPLPGHALRCVAVSPKAPRRGYMSSDIPAALWNRYQLNKAELYRNATAPGNTTLHQ